MRSLRKSLRFIQFWRTGCRSFGCISTPCKHGKYFILNKQLPQPQEVIRLNQQFLDPEHTINKLMDKYATPEHNYGAYMNTTQLRSGRWRAELKMKWPLPFNVSGVSVDRERAEHYAYLQACDMLVQLGVLRPAHRGCEMFINYKKELLQLDPERHYKSSFTFPGSNHVVRFCTQPWDSEGTVGQSWRCSLRLNWPKCITSTGYGRTRHQAEQNAAAMAFIRLKTQFLLDNKNMINAASYPALLPAQGHRSSQPDYEFFVDSSRHGYGAFLRTPSSPDDKVHWIQETWPQEVLQEASEKSSFLEMYAVLCALFTWKKKFQGKEVLCWSDNTACVSAVNYGLPTRMRGNMLRDTVKIFEILHSTCIQYDICLSARHLRRWENVPADLLSKQCSGLFRQIVPNTMDMPKKPKKLLFFRPLIQTQPISVRYYVRHKETIAGVECALEATFFGKDSVKEAALLASRV